MKKITYYNREIKDSVNVYQTEPLTDDDFEIKELTIEVEDSDLDYYLNIINTSYGEFGEVTVDEGTPAQPTAEERISALEDAITMIMGV